MPDRITDELLLEKASNGDQAAFLLLYERHRSAVYRFAYRFTGSSETAEDITHDCFLGLIRNPRGFDPGRAALRTYLLASARNLALKHFRNLSRETGMDELTIEPSAERRESPLGRVLDKELIVKVREAVRNLPPLQREAVILFEYEGLPLNDIAAVTESEVGAVKSRLFRARESLRAALEPYLNSHREIATLEKA